MRYKNLFFTICIVLFSNTTFAQNKSDEDGIGFEDDYFIENLDTLTFCGIESIPEDSMMEVALKELANIPDSVYVNRLADIESPIIFPYNSIVKRYIELYTKKRRKQVSVMLGLSDYYFPMFEQELDAAGLPLELKYIPIIESALNPRAFSRAGASGLWQFMYYTGKEYGLQVNSYVDDRRDPVKSTKAAVKFLEDLYDIYGDWYLVIAAYNCGPGNVNKAIRRSGNKRGIWDIYYRLPRETRGYVPAFIAAAYAMTYNQEHLIDPIKCDIPEKTDTVMINQPLHFEQVASMIDVDVDELRELNPSYRLDVIPSMGKSYPIRLPSDDVDAFLAQEDLIFAFEKEKYFSNNKLKEPSYASASSTAPKNKSKLYYTVKSGDVVGLIADWYDVRTSDLRYWNNIRRNVIKVGQKLTIYVPKNKVNYYAQINKMSKSQKKSLDGKTVVVAQSNSSNNSGSYSGDYVTYTVKSGDNLWQIAKRYPGISSTDIKKVNGLNSDRLSAGQKLKIPSKG